MTKSTKRQPWTVKQNKGGRFQVDTPDGLIEVHGKKNDQKRATLIAAAPVGDAVIQEILGLAFRTENEYRPIPEGDRNRIVGLCRDYIAAKENGDTGEYAFLGPDALHPQGKDA